MHIFLTKGITETDLLWSDVRQGHTWVRRAAHILTNDEKQTATQVRHAYEQLLTEMDQSPTSSEAQTTMVATFRKVTTSYWPGLFHCYDISDLPRTNNELEHYLVQLAIMNGERADENVRHQGLVVRGAVRVVASVASRLHPFSVTELCLPNLTQWRALRKELNHRHEARRMQHRFRKSPEKYLVDLEEKLIKERLPS